MNCPKCESTVRPNQKFCRACGASLQIITQPLADDLAISASSQTPKYPLKNERRWVNKLPMWGFIIMFLGVITGVMGKMLMHDEMVIFTGVLFSLIGMFLTVFPYVLPSPQPKYDSTSVTQPESLTQSRLNYLPQESGAGYIPSITERTTNLLPYPIETKPGQKKGEESQSQ